MAESFYANESLVKDSKEVRKNISNLISLLEEEIVDCKFQYGSKSISLEVLEKLEKIKRQLRIIMWENDEKWAMD